MRLAELWYASPAYRLLLQGRTPSHLLRLPPPPWPGDPDRGAALLSGKSTPETDAFALTPQIWANTDFPARVAAYLHGFSWLNDIAAEGSERAAGLTQGLIASWIDANEGWSALVWSPGVLGTRIGAWLSHARLIAPRENDPLGRRILSSLAQQVRHLERVVSAAAESIERLMAIRGLVYAAACGVGSRGTLRHALQRLSTELARQIAADGSHLSRSPRDQVRAFAALVDMQNMLTMAEQVPPADLTRAIERMAPVVRFFRHGDGRFAQFNGASEDETCPIDSILAAAKVPMQELAPGYAGFQRLSARKAVVLMDCGPAAPPGFNADYHAGTLSFEFSWGRERLVVNCGATGRPEPAIQRAERSTAAHSAFVVDDTNSSDALSAQPTRQSMATTCQRKATDGAVWLDSSHDGYQPKLGLIHRRRLYLSPEGDDLRGEDTLTGPHRGTFALRFHLHPDVDASLVQAGAAVLVRQRSGTAWRFQATGGRVDLSESVYLGRKGRRRTEQIVVAGSLDGQGAQVKWALKKIGAQHLA